MKKIGILGGTFNPVHSEHVALGLSAVSELGLDKLIVMPTFISPHKNLIPLPAEDRLNMLQLAFFGEDKIEVSDFEIQKQGKSYTYQTVEYFKSKEESELFFIVGGDMLTDFKTWRFPERILDACTLAVFDREDFYTDYEYEKNYFKEKFQREFIKLSYVGKTVSSTEIRVYSSLSLPIGHLVPERVESYIKQNSLYVGDKYFEFIRKNLPEKRVKHTADVVICAMKKVKELNLDANKVITACVLHDCAKYLDYKEFEEFSLPQGVPQPVVHSFLGAFVAEKILGVTDQEVLDAIRYHTSGKANMSTLAKLVFVADMLEKGRTYEGVDKLREIYEKENLDKCFIECLKEEFIHLINKKQPIFIETLNAFDYYVKN